MDSPNFNNLEINTLIEQKKKVHIPFLDVDDIAFKNRHDPNFVASITNMMQVPSTITLTNGQTPQTQRISHKFVENASFPMDIPEKLTADGILNNRPDESSPYSESYDEQKENNVNDTTATPPSTPTKINLIEKSFIEDNFSKTPQIAADLFERMRPRRSSIEVDLHAEIRILRDKINDLEHECQVNSRSCKVFYAILCGYVLLKTFSWLINK